MAAMDYDHEITEFKRRVDEVEREVDGEKMLSRHIYQKVQANERLLLEIRDVLMGQRGEIDGLRGEFSNLRADVNKLKTDMALLRSDMPDIVAQAVRQAFREAR